MAQGAEKSKAGIVEKGGRLSSLGVALLQRGYSFCPYLRDPENRPRELGTVEN